MGDENFAIDIPYEYWMARYPITNEQFNVYVKAKVHYHPVHNWEKKKDHPVVKVSWYEAMEYSKWLNSLLTELPLNTVLRLPTESEWEKAARGTDGRLFPWGNDFDKNKCNSAETEKDETTSTTPVGLYSPHGDSPYGCADMSGNVWEWVNSEIKEYPYNAKDGREDEKKYVVRGTRGGCFETLDWLVRCANRGGINPRGSDDTISFRVCIAPPLPKRVFLK